MRDGTIKLLSFIKECNKIEEVEQLRDLIRNPLRSLLPHQMAVCGFAELAPCRIVRLINVDFPAGYLQRIIRPDQIVLNPEFKSWVCRQEPMLIRLTGNDAAVGRACRRPARDYKIDNVALYGVVDLCASTSSYFAFGNLHPSAIETYSSLLKAVVPHLHVSLIRILTRHYVKTVHDHADGAGVSIPELDGRDFLRTTDRERQILQCISAGKSNREIARLLGISEFTVKTHVQNLLAKLSVTSRAQAVRKAIVGRLFETE